MPEPASSGLMIHAKALSKRYRRGREELQALQDITFEIAQGEFVAITGPSGSGKTTLLSLIGCMDHPTSGVLRILEQEVQALTEAERTQLRRRRLGFVFQHFGLLPGLTVKENILLPSLFAGEPNETRAIQLMEKTGLAGRASHRPHQLSGGEMQRVAIARALINCPQILLADEPTGNLDSQNAGMILDLFHQLRADGLTILLVTHNLDLASRTERQISLRDGRMV